MLPHDGTRDFILVGFRFLAELFADYHADGPPRLARPVNEDFPFVGLGGDELVRALFVQTASMMGADPAEYVLVPHESVKPLESPIRAGIGSFASVATSTPIVAGTYSVDPEGRPVISYEVSTVANTDGLVATFAHELAHDLLHIADTVLPGPEEADEPFTDLTAAYLGFGIFGANAAFQFQHVADGLMTGYTTNRAGYLSVEEWSYALALFAHVHAIPAKVIRRHLSRYGETPFVESFREIADRRLEDVRAIQARLPLGGAEMARAAVPQFGRHVDAPSFLGRLFGR